MYDCGFALWDQSLGLIVGLHCSVVLSEQLLIECVMVFGKAIASWRVDQSAEVLRGV